MIGISILSISKNGVVDDKERIFWLFLGFHRIDLFEKQRFRKNTITVV